MTTENALPVATEVAVVSASEAAEYVEQTEANRSIDQESADTKPAEAAKPEKTPEQREIDRLRRGIDRRTRQLAEERARNQLTRESIGNSIRPEVSDSETLSLSRSELDALVKREAEKLAPTIKQQRDEIEHRESVISELSKVWGQEKFDAYASDLDDAFSGLADRSGKPKPATDAIFESDSPKALIEYLTDPDHADEAEALSRMSAIQAGRAVAKLEAKLEAAAKAKPQASKAAEPLSPIKGGGTLNAAPDPSNTKAWVKWANEQERKSA